MDMFPDMPIVLGNKTTRIFPGGSDGKESTCNAGDLDSIPRLGRSPGGGHGNRFQYYCLENPHGQGSLVGYSPWGHKVGHNRVTKRSTAQKGSIPLYKTMNFEFDLANDIWTRVMFFHLSKNQRLATVRAVKQKEKKQ